MLLTFVTRFKLNGLMELHATYHVTGTPYIDKKQFYYGYGAILLHSAMIAIFSIEQHDIMQKCAQNKSCCKCSRSRFVSFTLTVHCMCVKLQTKNSMANMMLLLSRLYRGILQLLHYYLFKRLHDLDSWKILTSFVRRYMNSENKKSRPIH
jgi:hypothetical protein